MKNILRYAMALLLSAQLALGQVKIVVPGDITGTVLGTDTSWASINTPYTTLTGTSASGFTATYSSGSGMKGAWSGEFGVINGQAVTVRYTLARVSGQSPIIQITSTGATSLASNTPSGISNAVTMVDGYSYATLTPTASGMARLVIYNTGNTSFTVSQVLATDAAQTYDRKQQSYRTPRITAGGEYLGAWRTALTPPTTAPLTGVTADICIVGDSGIADPATSVSDSTQNVAQIITRYLRARYGTGITVNNIAVGGTYTADYLTGGAQAAAFASAIAGKPKLFILSIALNDLSLGRAGAITRYAALIDQIRAGCTMAESSILVVAPFSANDTALGRDMSALRTFTPLLRDLADTKKCGFVDEFAANQDSEAMKGITWDTLGTGGQPIHALGPQNYSRASNILDLISPRAYEIAQNTSRVVLNATSGVWLNSWSNSDETTYAPLCYTRDPQGIVSVVGMIKPGTKTDATPMFVLPVGYRPTKVQQFWTNVATSTGNDFCIIDVATNGQVRIYYAAALSVVYLRLNFHFSSL